MSLENTLKMCGCNENFWQRYYSRYADCHPKKKNWELLEALKYARNVTRKTLEKLLNRTEKGEL